MSRFKDLFQSNKRNIIIILLLTLVISLSFGLGYLFAQENNRAPIVIEKCSSN
jgi:uncharacterized membrane protein affecting hemolysin expression